MIHMEEMKKQLNSIGAYVVKGIVIALVSLSAFIFNQMKDSMAKIENSVETISDVVIRLDEKVSTNRDDIKDLKQDVKRLEETKEDK